MKRTSILDRYWNYKTSLENPESVIARNRQKDVMSLGTNIGTHAVDLIAKDMESVRRHILNKYKANITDNEDELLGKSVAMETIYQLNTLLGKDYCQSM